MMVNFEKEVSPESVGMSQVGIDALLGVLAEEADIGWHKAAQLVVLRHGQIVLDRTFGVVKRGQVIRPETPFFTFSIAKAFTGMCVHMLIEQGKIEMELRGKVHRAQNERREHPPRHRLRDVVVLKEADLPVEKFPQKKDQNRPDHRLPR